MMKLGFLATLFPFIFGCTNIPIEGLKSLEFGYSDGRRIKAVYKIDSDSTGYTVTIQKGYSDENLPTFTATAQQIAELEQVLNSYEVGSWDGFKRSALNVKDGINFHLYIWLKNGKSIHASGYESYPKNYKEVRKALEEFFERYQE